MTSAQVVETHPNNRTLLNYDMTPGFKKFTILSLSGKIPVIKEKLRACNYGWQMYSKDALMIAMGKPSCPGALGTTLQALY